VLAGEHARLTADGFLTLVTSSVGFGATSSGSPRYPISGTKDGKSKMIFAGSGRTRAGFALHKSRSRAIVRAGAGSGIGNSRAMKVAIIKERRAYERRVAASPDSIKRMVEMGLEVAAETGAGSEASFPDDALPRRERRSPRMPRRHWTVPISC